MEDQDTKIGSEDTALSSFDADTHPSDSSSFDADTRSSDGASCSDREQCNGRDDDCDGKVDENLKQICGKTYTGQCSKGTKQCNNGTWSECQGNRPPAPETCNGKDDDCDGDIDPNCKCVNGTTRPCGMTRGRCQQGSQTCKKGTWGKCKGKVTSRAEVCNGQDDDCDGEIDEKVTRSCGKSKGICQTGQQACQNGTWQACKNRTSPSKEVCDGKDNDCDGQTDEKVTRSCGKSKGICQSGEQTCQNGTWQACKNQTSPSKEVCDGKDNDCDGETDEKVTRSCGKSKGLCQTGQQACQNGTWQACKNQTSPSKEVCDGKDNDCDGKTDENCNNDGDGYCKASRKTIGKPSVCSKGGGDCDDSSSAVNPSVSETCNGKDDDCDGVIDEWDAGCRGVDMIGTSKQDRVFAVATDSNGNVIVGGKTFGAFGNRTNAGREDAFIAKYDSVGRRQWVREMRGPYDDIVWDVAVDSNDDIVVGGGTFGGFGGHAAARSDQGFVAKYTASGQRQWVELIGKSGGDEAFGVAVDASNRVYLVGWVSSAIAGEPFEGIHDAFLASYSPSGTRRWVELLGSPENEKVQDVTFGGNGALFLTGYTQTKLKGKSYSGGDTDGWVARYDTSGNRKWLQMLGTSGEEELPTVSARSGSSVYVGGWTTQDIGSQTHLGSRDGLVAKYDRSGNQQWVRLVSTSDYDDVTGTAVTGSGEVVISGKIEGVYAGKSRSRDDDLFVISFDDSGNRRWVEVIGSKEEQTDADVGIGPSGGIFGVGSSQDSVGGATYHGGFRDGFVFRAR